jgi:hypothetical protein
MYKQEFFRVSNGNLERIRGSEFGDYVLPSVFVLPSLAVWTASFTVRTPKQTEAVLKKHFKNPKSLKDDEYEYRTRGRTLSIILPAGLNLQSSDGSNVSIGIGASLGWSLTSGSEAGIALAAVWSQSPYLSDEQRKYIGGALPDGVSDQIDTRLRPMAVLGLYLTPTF